MSRRLVGLANGLAARCRRLPSTSVYPAPLCSLHHRSSQTWRPALSRCHSTANAHNESSFNEKGAEEQAENTEEAKTHFGFETVPEHEKTERVYKVFENVADKYDLMNDAMSAGVHRLWKDIFIERMAPTAGTKLLDVAGGTGDIALRFLQYLDNMEGDIKDPTMELDEAEEAAQSSQVTISDINQAMLDVGQSKMEKLGYYNIQYVKADAEDLPFDDNSFDVYSIAFGIRNCTHVDRVLEEAYRVLRPGGRFMCLEFSRVDNPVLSGLYDLYSFQVIPVMGQVLAGDYRSYQYLVESIRQFPGQEEFGHMIEDAGFRMVTHENLTFGVAAIHSGFKV